MRNAIARLLACSLCLAAAAPSHGALWSTVNITQSPGSPKFTYEYFNVSLGATLTNPANFGAGLGSTSAGAMVHASHIDVVPTHVERMRIATCAGNYVNVRTTDMYAQAIGAANGVVGTGGGSGTVPTRVVLEQFRQYTYSPTWGNGPKSIGVGLITLKDLTTNTVLQQITPDAAGNLPIVDVPRGHRVELTVQSTSDLRGAGGGPGTTNGTLRSLEIWAHLETAARLTRGDVQDYPIQPDTGRGTIAFNDQRGGKWFDAGSAKSFTYTTTSNSLFTAIDDFPVADDTTFHVIAENQDLGTFTSGSSLDIAALLGHGVSQFTIAGVDEGGIARSMALPLQLGFNTDTASFAVSVPEPTTAGLLVMAVALATRPRRPL